MNPASSIAYEADIVLRDGSTLHIRPLEPRDRSVVLALHRRLTPESRHLRCCAPAADAGAPPLDVLTEVDFKDTFALVAEVCGRVVAAAHYFRSAENPEQAEVCFVTDDALHGRGIGMRMLELLSDVARDQGVRAFEAEVLGENQKMMDVFLTSGYEVTSRLEGGQFHVTFPLAESRQFEERHARRSREAAVASMKVFFEPKSIAVIGAGRMGSAGWRIFNNLLTRGFQGVAYPVSARATHVCAVKCFPRITAIPDDVELAIVCVPVSATLGVIDDCIAKGVRGIICVTSGFAESGPEGRQIEQAMLEKVRAAGIRLIGPNCMGVINAAPAVSLNASFAPTHPRPGRIALSTQSGALGMTVLNYVEKLNIGISSFASIGNKPDVSGNDLIQYWEEDPRTDVILLYLESFGNPRRFSTIARRVSRMKPIVAVKSGRTRAGARAASSHSASLASTDHAVDALFRQSGIIRTGTLEEMFDVAALLAHQPIPAGRRVAVLTNGGGPGILAADALEAQGLVLPTLADATVKSLRSFLPRGACVSNPVDIVSAAPDNYGRALETLLADPSVDAVIVICIPLDAHEIPAVAAEIADQSRKFEHKTVLANLMTTQGVPYELRHVPNYSFPESAAVALAHAVEYGEWLRRPVGAVPVFEDVDAARVRAVVDTALARGDGWLQVEEIHALLSAVGIAAAPQRVLGLDRDALGAAALEVGYPVVLKAIVPGLQHKTEAGAVCLDLADEAQLLAAYDALVERLGDRMSGVLVQQMVSPGVEVIVGASLDPTFGPLVMYGTGGVGVELVKDVTFALHPLTEIDAEEMLGRVKGTALLRGWRGSPRADEAALRETLLRLSHLIELCPEIQELDVNPLKVLPLEGREAGAPGAIAVDARVRVSRATVAPSRRIVY